MAPAVVPALSFLFSFWEFGILFLKQPGDSFTGPTQNKSVSSPHTQKMTWKVCNASYKLFTAEGHTEVKHRRDTSVTTTGCSRGERLKGGARRKQSVQSSPAKNKFKILGVSMRKIKSEKLSGATFCLFFLHVWARRPPPRRRRINLRSLTSCLCSKKKKSKKIKWELWEDSELMTPCISKILHVHIQRYLQRRKFAVRVLNGRRFYLEIPDTSAQSDFCGIVHSNMDMQLSVAAI